MMKSRTSCGCHGINARLAALAEPERRQSFCNEALVGSTFAHSNHDRHCNYPNQDEPSARRTGEPRTYLTMA
ncbi:hypothetical protein KCP73_03495 [Salmonella enterica subsp. enterica]|nr:hypothetical protein KCP73_03495 [Salmonella enterica subsp. enterica]